MKDAILVVDDEAGVRSSLAGILGDEGYAVTAADSGEAGLAALEARRYDLVLLDVWLPGLDGLEVLRRIRERDSELPVVVISGHGTIETAVKAVRLGAQDFVEKPLSLEKTVLAVRNALRQRRLESQTARAAAAARARATRWSARAPRCSGCARRSHQAAPSNGRVLIIGENGTGKELVARAIHAQSQRAAGPFVEVNCAAIPEELIESELFGHAKGAFTGAHATRKGKFELADGGTLFLDEIGDMSLKTQAKVLRALQEQRVEPVGGSGSVDVDVRVIAATNKDLEAEIRTGRFREDLYFRLNVIPFQVPPLRERREDIPLLVRHFMQVLSRRARPQGARGGAGRARGARAAAVAGQRPRAAQHPRAAGDHDSRRADRATAPAGDTRRVAARASAAADESSPAASGDGTLLAAREAFERRYILERYRECGGNMSRTAESLGVERSNLYRKMKAFGLLPARRDQADGAFEA